MSPRAWRRVSHLALWALCLYPAARLAYDFFTGGLSVNPIEDITNRTGWWALFALAATLAITPLRRLTKWHWLVRYRRQLGLTSFIYATMHLATYAVLDLGFDLSHLWGDLRERPFMTVGFLAWLILLALAFTSTRRAIRAMGSRWQKLHRFVYLAAGLAVLHFFWSQKADKVEPLIFAGVFAVLLGARLVYAVVRRRRNAYPPSPSTSSTASPRGDSR
ncbi:MAG: sulfoxide reductase heme-binding subunit YedZ [Trueperaceae bacterium]|nr:sulfoxide reductase heme-binding subunit YedZ [Trueperaceae bacterium]